MAQWPKVKEINHICCDEVQHHFGFVIIPKTTKYMEDVQLSSFKY